MPIFVKGKSKYVESVIDGETYCLTSGHFAKNVALHGLTIEQYVLKYEPPVKRQLCACGEVTKLCGSDGHSWAFLRVCGKQECAKNARAAGIRAMGAEKRRATMGAKAKATLAADPKRMAAAIKNNKIGNSSIGPDGLTGYQRAAKKRAETLLNKYGRSDYAGWDKAKKTCKNRTDEERQIIGNNISVGWQRMSDEDKLRSKQKRARTNISRYGMECPANTAVFTSYSKIASSLFEQLDDGASEFKPKCREHSVSGRIFDFRSGNKLIEFNGDYWHAKPSKYSPDALIGRTRKRKASEIWDTDARKIAFAEAKGYQVKVVWESDYKRNPEKVIKECLEWLKN
jgi:hypothetical protein